MQKLHFSITIDAPREHVWKTMLEDATYREWTEVFSPGSSYEGSWEKGSKIKFVGPDENGKMGGMSSEIAESNPYEFVSAHHIGVVVDGVEDTTSEEAKKWNGYENYTFKDLDGKTELTVDMDMNEEGVEYMSEAWPKALQKLKEIAER
jgi:uncharacterized protein YndB with AHSA1/START domain